MSALRLSMFQLFQAVLLTVSSNRFQKKKISGSHQFQRVRTKLRFVNGIFHYFSKLPLVNELNFFNGFNGKFSTIITELTVLINLLTVYYSIDGVKFLFTSSMQFQAEKKLNSLFFKKPFRFCFNRVFVETANPFS